MRFYRALSTIYKSFEVGESIDEIVNDFPNRFWRRRHTIAIALSASVCDGIVWADNHAIVRFQRRAENGNTTPPPPPYLTTVRAHRGFRIGADTSSVAVFGETVPHERALFYAATSVYIFGVAVRTLRHDTRKLRIITVYA